MDRKSIGAQIKAVREEQGLSQEELGKRVGVTGVSIMRYEKGQREPTHEMIKKLADALQVHWLRLIDPNMSGLCTLIRLQNGLSREELAERAGISPEAVEKYELENSSPPTDAFAVVCELMGIEMPEETYQRLKAGEARIAAGEAKIAALEQQHAETEQELQDLKQHCRDLNLSIAFYQLNERGQQIAIERVQELAKIPDYQNPEAIAELHAAEASPE